MQILYFGTRYNTNVTPYCFLSSGGPFLGFKFYRTRPSAPGTVFSGVGGVGIGRVHPFHRGHHGFEGMQGLYSHNRKGYILACNRYAVMEHRIFYQMERNGQAVF